MHQMYVNTHRFGVGYVIGCIVCSMMCWNRNSCLIVVMLIVLHAKDVMLLHPRLSNEKKRERNIVE